MLRVPPFNPPYAQRSTHAAARWCCAQHSQHAAAQGVDAGAYTLPAAATREPGSELGGLRGEPRALTTCVIARADLRSAERGLVSAEETTVSASSAPCGAPKNERATLHDMASKAEERDGSNLVAARPVLTPSALLLGVDGVAWGLKRSQRGAQAHGDGKWASSA